MNSNIWRINSCQHLARMSVLTRIISLGMVALSLHLMIPLTAQAALDPASYDANLDGVQKAFPTAEGFGKYAQGGRGGDVYVVSNLNDSGRGSLRECVEASGPRTCVFSVSGEIKTRDTIRANNPYLTIAGQTAPGDGIMLTIRDTNSVNSPLVIVADHVIVRHISVRPGPPQAASDTVDAIGLGGSHIIIDHVTMSWGTDETLGSGGNSGITNYSGSANSQNITVQWSMIYESLENANHPSGSHSRSTYLGYGTQDITFHHNIIANSNRRNPNIGGVGQLDYINNVQFSNGLLNGELYNRHGSSYYNWIGNVAIAGPATQKRDNIYQADLFNNNDLGALEMYVKDNIDIHRPTNTGDERLVIDPKDYGRLTTAGPIGYGELSLPASEISAPDQAYKDVLEFAGAIKPARDAADEGFVADIRHCDGNIIDHPDEVGGWPILNSTTPPADNDKDGMTDSWETARGLNPNNAADRNDDDDNDGYTNLEEYLNQLAGDDHGSMVGRGSGADPDPTCGYSFSNGQGPIIHQLNISPKAIRPGEPVTITWEAEANSCQRGWDRHGSPHLMSGSQTATFEQSTTIDISCNRNSVDDKEARYLFVNAAGQVPIPSLSFSSDHTNLNYGDTVTFSWRAGEPLHFEAGECEASGMWNGFKTTAGMESFVAMNSGDYHLTCTGPGGATTKTVTLFVSGGSPAPAPTPSGFGVGACVVLTAPANLRGANRRGTGAYQDTGATGVIVDGPQNGGGGTQFWDIDFDFGADGWVRDTQLSLVSPTPTPTPAPTATITANPANLIAGDSTTLTWTSSNSDSCTASGDWSGTKGTDGTESVSPTSDATYAIDCTGPGGSASDRVAVNVTQPTPTPGGFGVGARVALTAPANLRDARLRGTGGRQGSGATGVIVGGPQNGGGGTQFWDIDFDFGADGWVRDTQLALNGIN